MARNLVNIQNTGAAISRPMPRSISQLRRLCAAPDCAWRSPCAAQAKHRVQLKTKPMLVISAALSNKAPDIQAKPRQQGAPVGGGAGNFFGSSAQAAAQAAQESQARMRAEMGPPQGVAAMEPPRQTARREMRGPSGVDDILQSFAEARRNESMDGSAFPEVPANPQPAMAAAIEIQSMGSDDIGSTTESKAGGGRRRRRQAVGNTLSLNV